MALDLANIKTIRTASGLAIKKVMTASGKVLWKASTPYYAIQNGKLVNAPNAYAWEAGYGGSGAGEINNGYGTFYGGSGHTDDNAGNWGGSTGNMNPQGCKYVTVTTFTNNAGAVLSLYGNDALIRQEGVAVGTSTYTFDISAYSAVGVLIDCFGQYPSRDEWMNVGLVNVQFHD